MVEMKAMGYITNASKRKALWRAFRMWQRRRPRLAPMSAAKHECASCGTRYGGNYCPRCGQAASVGRFSFKKAVLQFLDVWGFGNRSMFRTLRDLVLRPGFLIRDYISGMQSAYFPPFKLFFIMAALALLVEHGCTLDPDARNTISQSSQHEIEVVEKVTNDRTGKHLVINGHTVESPLYYTGVKVGKSLNKLRTKNPAIFALTALVLFFLPLYFFLRKAPNSKGLLFPEFIIALVYTANAFSIFSIAGNFLGFSVLRLLAFVQLFISLKQFSGYGGWRMLCYLIVTAIVTSLVVVGITAGGIYLIYNDLVK